LLDAARRVTSHPQRGRDAIPREHLARLSGELCVADEFPEHGSFSMFCIKGCQPLASSKMAKAESAKEEAPILSDPAGYLRRSINVGVQENISCRKLKLEIDAVGTFHESLLHANDSFPKVSI